MQSETSLLWRSFYSRQGVSAAQRGWAGGGNEEKERGSKEKNEKEDQYQTVRYQGTEEIRKESKNEKAKGKLRNEVLVTSNSSSTSNGNDVDNIGKASSSKSDEEQATYLDSEEELCQERGRKWKNDDEESQLCWMGCDTCPRWFHYWDWLAFLIAFGLVTIINYCVFEYVCIRT